MELREYLSIRRAYNLVRQEAGEGMRLTFSELAILCRLDLAKEPLRTSDIADYQGSLRPTMTHRTKHLASVGLIGRVKGDSDHRNVVCELTDEGRACVEELCARTCAKIGGGKALSRVTSERMRRYVDAMGSLPCSAGELILLQLMATEGETGSVTGLVEDLGLLQPTVSMSAAALVGEGLVKRIPATPTARSSALVLTDEGRVRAEALAEQVRALIVRRKPRSEQ